MKDKNKILYCRNSSKTNIQIADRGKPDTSITQIHDY